MGNCKIIRDMIKSGHKAPTGQTTFKWLSFIVVNK